MSEFKEYHNANHHDGDDTFDDQTYKMTNGEDFDDQFVQDCFDHFKAGQQSQQAKIDLLEKELIETQDFLNKQNHIKQAKIDCMQVRLDGANERAMSLLNHKNRMVDKMQAEIDELQKRIDGALEKCYTGIRKQGGDHYLELVENILKGNKDLTKFDKITGFEK